MADLAVPLVHVYISNVIAMRGVIVLLSRICLCRAPNILCADGQSVQSAISQPYLTVNLARNAKLSLVKSIFIYLFILFFVRS